MIGENLKKIRKKKKLSQHEVATAAGISVRTLQRFENEERSPNTETLTKIIKAMGMSLSHFMDYERVEDFLKTFNGDGVTMEQLLDIYGVSSFDEFLINFRAGSLEDLLKKFDDDTPKDALLTAFDQLNPQGQKKAVENMELLTKVPEYKK